MVRRSLGALLWSLVGLLACFLGALSALVGTETGRALLTRVSTAALESVVAGRVELGSTSGSLLTGLVYSDVRLYDHDTTLVAWLPRAELDYNLLDFVAGQVVLQRVRLEHPYFNIVQHKNGRLNIEELLHLGEPSKGPRRGPKPLVVLRNVTIVDGDLILRLQSRPSPGDSLLEIDAFGSDGRRRVRRFQHLTARLTAFRISAPGQRGLRVDLAGLAVGISDPAVDIANMRGRVTIDGDSLNADLPEVRLPASRFSVRGGLAWPDGPLLYDLIIGADSVTLADARFIDPRFPEGAVLHGALAVRSHGSRMLEVRLDTLDLAYNGGRAQGRATAFIAADSGLVALRSTDVTTTDLDLSLPRAFLDTLPFYGHLSGRAVADGQLSDLTLDADWAFRDSLVAGWPVSRVRGRGAVNLTASEGITFLPFTVDTAAIDFGTFTEFVPAPLHGTLDAVGMLSGPLLNVRFDGALRHVDGDRPASVAHGHFGADARRDTVALDVDAQLDTLSFDGLSGSFPGLGLRGAVAGAVRLAGPLDSVATHLDVVRVGGGGRIRADGALVLLPDRRGARGLTVEAAGMSLQRWVAGKGTPPSELNLTATVSLDADSSGAPPVGAIAARVGGSRVAGTVVDSGALRLRFADGLIHVDTVWLRQPGLITEGAGTLGWRRPRTGEAFLSFDADSLATLDSAISWVSGAWRDTARAQVTSGTAVAHLRLAGALDSLAIGGLGKVERLAVGTWRVPAADVRGGYEPGSAPLVFADGSADSIAHGAMGFGAVRAGVRGRLDSLQWSGRTRIGDLSGVVAGGRYIRDTAGAKQLAVDSFAVRLPGGVWFLEAPATLRFGDSVVAIDSVAMRRVNGPGHLALAGTIPTGGNGLAQLHIEGFPLAGVNALLQRDTLGTTGGVSVDLTVRGSRREPSYDGRFALVPDSAGAPSVDGTFAYARRRLDAAASLKRGAREVVGFTAHLPLDLALERVPRRQLPDTLSIRARADGAGLDALEALTTQVRDVRGLVTADVGIRGTWDAPRLDGTMRIDSAGVAIPALNVRWEGIAGRLRLGGDTIYVDSLGLRSERGRADLGGYVRLERLTHPVLALDIESQDFKALEVKGDLSVMASGKLALRGPVFGATLTGTGTVTNGVLYFADLVEKRIVDLDAPDPSMAGLIDTALAAVIRRQGLGPSFHSLFLDSLRIRDVQLAMGSSVWLRSNEANIQLAGRLNVNKVHRNWLLTGTLQAPRGTYRLQVGPVSREFVVTQGTVRYFGTPDLDAALDIEARHVVHPLSTVNASSSSQDVTVIAHIGGTLLVPRLTLSAEGRTLPQTDILSYLMFGQASAEVANAPGAAGAGRKALLFITAASFAAGELERSVVSDLGIPLDYVEIRPGDPGNLL
ncbi:MAG TPA: translocation/assembly module TamB domain-containing protein, partial [Gemmatimonadales bacterium]|nr:translocation/assembly module TamB domain-containing protein [Gemmatimonadales bacterium]